MNLFGFRMFLISLIVLMDPSAWAQEAVAPRAPSPWVSFIPIALMFAIFYFLLIRPQQKRQKEHERMVRELRRNDVVVTSGGIHGMIVNLKEKTAILKVDTNTTLEVDKAHISAVTQKGE